MKLLVIGLGSIGKRHITNFIAAGLKPEDIGGVDPREDRRREVQTRFGMNKLYATLQETQSQRFDAAIICSPTSYHIDQGSWLAKRGTHLMIEKPLAADLKGAQQLQKVVQDKKVKVLIAYIFRFSPTVAKIKEVLASKVLGRPLFFRGEFSEYLPDWHPWEDYRSFYMAKKSQGGGSILDQSHIIDLAHHLMGDIEGVFCFNDLYSDLEVDADDMAEMVVNFKSGAVGSIHTDMFGRHHKKELEIKGTEGNLLWNFYDYSVSVYHGKEKRWDKWMFKKDPNEMYTYETKHFIDCVRGKTKSMIPLEEGISSMKIILAAERSAKTKKFCKI